MKTQANEVEAQRKGWQLIGLVRLEWRWNGNWRMDDEHQWIDPDLAVLEARELYAKINEKLTAVRLINRNGDVIWQEGR